MAWKELKNIEELTEGGCAKLFTATLRESTVVVKKFKLNKHLAKTKSKLRKEVAKLLQLKHQNVVQCLGVCGGSIVGSGACV